MWKGWEDLQSERDLKVGFGGALWLALPWSKRMAWLDRHGIEGQQAELIDGAWVHMDRIWLEHQNRPKEGESAGE